MQIVNGYLCMNCCDVDKARLGQDPHQSADQLQKQIDRQLGKSASGHFGAAVTFGGSLQTTDSGNDAASGNNSGNNNGSDPSTGGSVSASASQASPGARGSASPSSISVVV